MNPTDKISWNNLGIILSSLICVFFFLKLVSYSKSNTLIETTAKLHKPTTNIENIKSDPAINLNEIKSKQQKALPTKQTFVSFKEVDEDIPKGIFNYGGSTVWASIRNTVDSKIKAEIPHFKLRYLQHPIWNSSSSVGIKMLINDGLSIVQSSRPLTSLEKRTATNNGFELRQIAVAMDGIAILVNPDLEVSGLTVTQLRGIYSGKITNWKQVGGPDLKIIPYSKSPHASGTANYFTENILGDRYINTNVRLTTSTQEALEIIKANKGAIFYESAAEIASQCSVKSIPIGYNSQKFVSPYQGISNDFTNCNAKANQINRQSFEDASYPLTYKLYVIIKQNGQVEEAAGFAYVRLLLSEAGQKAISSAGFVPIRR